MYDQNFRNQAVKEVKNGSSVASAARKFDIAVNTLNIWVDKYDEKMYGMIKEESTKTIVKPVAQGIKLQSIKVLINGAVITLKRNDVLKLLNLFNIFDERIEGE